MTMTAERPSTSSVGVVVMTAAEARACVQEIKSHCEGIASALAELHDREGWRALGYASWTDCIRGEFNTSKQRAHQLLNLHTVSRILTTPVAVPGSTLLTPPDAQGIPESHARALKPLVSEPDTLRAVHAEVQAATVGKPTAADYERAVERVKPSPERRSVSSRAEASDFRDDAPDYADESQVVDDWADLGVIDGPGNGPRRPVGAICNDCREPIPPGQTRCGCMDVPRQETDALAGRTGADDGVAPVIVEAARLAGTEPAPAPPAVSSRHPSQERDRPFDDETARGSKGDGKRAPSVPARAFSGRPLDAGDLARALLDQPTAQIVEAVRENATPAQLAALRTAGLLQAAPQSAPATPSPERPDLKGALANRTILEMRDAILAAVPASGRLSLYAVLIDEEDATRLGPLAHRLAVRTRGADPTPEPAGLDVSLASVKGMLHQLSAADLRSLEFELPLIRKEVGARERAAQAAAV